MSERACELVCGGASPFGADDKNICLADVFGCKSRQGSYLFLQCAAGGCRSVFFVGVDVYLVVEAQFQKPGCDAGGSSLGVKLGQARRQVILNIFLGALAIPLL